jgi:hypothetical protein
MLLSTTPHFNSIIRKMWEYFRRSQSVTHCDSYHGQMGERRTGKGVDGRGWGAGEMGSGGAGERGSGRAGEMVEMVEMEQER